MYIISKHKGIIYARDVGKTDLMGELDEEMVQRHPVTGRLSRILIPFFFKTFNG